MKRCWRKEGGFTLMEVVLVLVLIGIVSAVLVSRLPALSVPSASLEEARLEIVSRIVHARNRALLLDGAVTPVLTFRDKGYAYREQKATGLFTVPGVVVTSTVSSLRFQADGTADSSALITLASPEATMTLKMEKSGYVHEVTHASTN